VIRTIWFFLVVAAATIFYGVWSIGASLFGVKGTLYSRLTQSWARAILRAAGVPVTTGGVENVRPDEPQIIVSNHVSWFDIFAIAAVLPLPFYFVAKKELERIPLFGAAWKAAGHISIDRSNRQKAIQSLRDAGEQVRRDRGSVIIFPEGTRSRSGRLQPFKKGAFSLALEAGVPIVPTVVTGSYDIMRPDSWTVHPQTVHLRFAEPVTPAPRESSDALTERVYAIIAEILGESDQLPPEA